MKTITGDLFANLPEDKKLVIPHVCNDIYLMARGFVVPLCERWPQVKTEYVLHKYPLGKTQFLHVEDNITVANMIAQHETIRTIEKPIRYAALVKCMEEVLEYCQSNGYGVICPKFGSDMARGNWDFIVELIDEIWGTLDVTVVSYAAK